MKRASTEPAAKTAANSSQGRLRAFIRAIRENPDVPIDALSALVQRNGDATTEEPTKPDKTQRRRYLREYARWLWPYRWGLATVFVIALLTATLDMIWPLGIKGIIDGVLLSKTLNWQQKFHGLNTYGLAIIALLVLKQALDSTRSYQTAALNAKVIFRLRRKLYEKLLSLPLATLADMKSGGIVSRLSGDVDAVSGLVQMALISPCVAIIRVILTVTILMVMSWRLAVGALLIVPPMAVMSYLWLRRVRPIYRSAQKDRIDVDGRVNETFGGIRVVRAFRREEREARSYAVSHHTIIRKMLWAQRLELVLEAVWGLLIPASSLLIAWYGGYLVLTSRAEVGDIFLFQVYAVLLLQPVWQIVSSVSQTQKSLAAMERVFETLEMAPDKPDVPEAIEADRRVREIRFESVAFEYRPGVPVIDDFDLTVKGGSMVALVGPSGAGKTTLTDLVARFQDPTRGTIRLNGVDLRKLQLSTYRSLLAVVQQDTFLFDGTVAENIAYGRRNATAAQIEDAARRANAHEFIEHLPQGYDTLIGERGFKLSGGQRQRISIARAVLADPQILILDEATSNLDTESEQLIQASLSVLFEGRTTFVIAHRLSTVTHADLIVALDEGRIREVGTHEALMERRGFYHEMVERQQQSFGTVAEDLVRE